MAEIPIQTASRIREHWTSRLGFILASTGAAVGLGNIWKFPYMAGDNGGGAFVLIYLLCVLAIGLPVMLAEMLIGRRGQQNTVNSLATLAHEAHSSRNWQWLGWLCALTLLISLSFYSVVAGWSLAYLAKGLRGDFIGLSATGINTQWHSLLSHPWELLAWHSLFMLMTIWVVSRGIQRGLELASRVMMPMLFSILIILVGYATSTPGFIAGFKFLLYPNFSKINANVIISAMGHAFFSLAVGAGAMLVYGSYLTKKIRLSSAIITITGLDVLVAILTGLAIFPIVFTYHLSPQGGPGLMFETLPVAFAQMGGGRFFASLFFLLLVFAAWTSSISMAEPIVILLSERYLFNRRRAAWVVGFITWLLGIPSLLSFNKWKSITLFNRFTLFDISTDLVTNILLPVGGLLFCIFAGWIMPKRATNSELGIKQHWGYDVWLFLVRYISPAGIILILLYPLLP